MCRNLRLVALSSVVLAMVSFNGCVGDTSTNVDGGQDATASDALTTETGTDANQNDANDAGACGMCDGSCYEGVCNGSAVVQVSMGQRHACAVLANGSLWCWGANLAGQIQSPPGTTNYAQATQISGVSNVTSVSAGADITCVVESDASVWCWGLNLDGALGHAPNTGGDVVCNGSDYCNATPTKVTGVAAKQVGAGRFNACAVTTTGSVVCWGWNGEGIVGGAPSKTDMPTPTVVGGLSQIAQISVSDWPGDNVCAIDTAANLWCWGSNGFDQLGHASGTMGDVACGQPPSGTGGTCSTTPIEVTALSNVASVAATWSTCATELGGSVWCWGSNGAGESGNGQAGANQPTPTAVSGLTNAKVMAGGQAMCALESTGDVDCWGYAGSEIPGSYGADAGCFAYATPCPCDLTPVKVVGVEASSLSVGATSAVAITTQGKVVAWGNNSNGELGHPIGTGDDSNDNDPTPTPVQGLP